jgi:hypothetical protein
MRTVSFSFQLKDLRMELMPSVAFCTKKTLSALQLILVAM